MGLINALIWQLAVVLAFLTVEICIYAAWCCCISLAVHMGRAENGH